MRMGADAGQAVRAGKCKQGKSGGGSVYVSLMVVLAGAMQWIVSARTKRFSKYSRYICTFRTTSAFQFPSVTVSIGFTGT